MRRSLTMGIVILAILPRAVAARPSQKQLDAMASSGAIEENAPVKTSVEITIDAPRDRVWNLLTDVKDWPSWEHDVSSAKISGLPTSGTAFVWKTSGTNIQSRLALVVPESAFAWTGKAYGIHVIHQWKLQQLPGDRTLVQTEESADGPLVTVFYSSKKLEASDQRWLNDLKLAAER